MPEMERPFSYRATKDGRVLLYWHQKQIRILKLREAQKFLTDIEDIDQQGQQLIMAKVTGNFKRGNEHQGKMQ